MKAEAVLKNIFITGASSGIGRSIATAAAKRGHQVWGTSRDTARLAQVPQFHGVRMDLSDPGSIEEGFNGALAEAGHFDVLINNAGSGHFGPAEDLSAETMADQFQVLVFAHIQLMRLALRDMQPRGDGLIINVTSLASRLPVPFMAAYNAAKAAMAAFTMSIQLELASQVHIVDLQPGDICTEFNDAVIRNGHNPRYERKIAKTWAAVEHNMKIAPKPELVARHVLELIGQKDPPPRLTVGDAFQTKIAPLIYRFLPQPLRIWGLKKYYGI